MYLHQLSDPCQTSLKVADPRRTVAGLHPYLTRTVTSRNRRSFDCSTLKIFNNHSRRANSRAARLLLSPSGVRISSPAVMLRFMTSANASNHWKRSTVTVKLFSHERENPEIVRRSRRHLLDYGCRYRDCKSRGRPRMAGGLRLATLCRKGFQFSAKTIGS